MDLGNIMKQLDADGDGFEISDLKNITKLDFSQLLGGDFLQNFTKFGSLNGLLSKLGVSKPEDISKVDPGKLDSVAKENSSFGSWQELLNAAKSKIMK
ncbi:MAG: hypothetical protein FWC55_02570 [Firmicutes bacterium]|nr:hypothetical protein [Bacillota bacterium]